jgi:hypothetical protein
MSKKGDLKVPIQIDDELFDEVIHSHALLNLASGEISQVEYHDYDEGVNGLPWENEEYDFSCGTLSNGGKDVEFSVQINKTTGQYSVSATELQEIKQKAAALFSGIAAP